MKRLIFILVFLPLMTAAAFCQTGLNIEKAFDGRYSNKAYADEVTVKGVNLLGVDINLYRALTVTDTNATDFIRDLVVKDGTRATLKEVTMRSGKLAYGFYQLQPAAKKSSKSARKRFIFFYENNGKGALIYMEGNASLKQIKQAIMNK